MKLECYPDKAQYYSGETVALIISAVNDITDEAELAIQIYHLDRIVKHLAYRPGRMAAGEKRVIALGSFSAGGYGVDMLNAHTAFDVVNKGDKIIRYGFLTDFGPEETSDEDIEFANRLHINAIQFYDWMYRHHELVCETEEYDNPMNIRISNAVLERKISMCKARNIRPFAYGAVYAAGKDFFEAHRDWAIYTRMHNVMNFADWLVFMNIKKECGWSNYIVEQFGNTVKKRGFQGIHMDTYGFPKRGCSFNGDALELENEFPELINNTAKKVRSLDSKSGVIFNAVNNWPVEKVAEADQDSTYIEVWPPHDTYFDLFCLIKKARSCAKKNTILAAYMTPFAKVSDRTAQKAFLLTYAVIHAAGGYQLALGENKGILCDSYYNNYARLPEEFIPQVEAYADFIVRYRELLDDYEASDISMTSVGGINEDIVFSSGSAAFSVKGAPGKVWTMASLHKTRLVINLINLIGEDEYWNKVKSGNIAFIDDISVRILMDTEIGGVYMSSPDINNGMVDELTYTLEEGSQGAYITLSGIRVSVWTTLWVDILYTG